MATLEDVVKAILWWLLIGMFGVSAFLMFAVIVGGLFSSWIIGIIAGTVMAGIFIFALNN